MIIRFFNFWASLQPILPTSPRSVTHCLTLATLTALQKKDGRVRGKSPLASHFADLVANTLAKQFGKTVEAACAPFQFTLSTQAGVDCVVTLCERSQTWTQTPHSSRSMVLGPTISSPKFHVGQAVGGSTPSSVAIRAFNLFPTSCYVWRDEVGRLHEVQQHGGGEQGDPL